MSNEAQVRSALQIRKQDSAGNVQLFYASQPQAFTDDVTGTKGPSPGAIAVTTSGTDVDLSQLTTPGLCRVMNIDDTNYVELGMRDAVTRVFYPLMEILPGQSYVFRFSRNVQEEYFPSTGTGTTAPIAKVHLKAHHAAVNVLVEAFEA